MTPLTQKDKECPCLAGAHGNFLCFRGQRDRRVPHTMFLQGTGAQRSAPYQNTLSPVVSTRDESRVASRTKQLISVLELHIDPNDKLR